MQQLYLHIGIHKTGTTYIQKCLGLNTDFLGQQGCCYPAEEIIDNSGHHNLAWSYLKQSLANSSLEPEAYQHKFYRNLVQTQCPSIIISSEEFDRFERSHIESLAQHLAQYGFQPKILIYIRRQDRLLISLYQELIKHGGTHEFKPWLTSLIDHGDNPYYVNCCNYLNLVRNWLACFENIEIIVYDNLNDAGIDIFQFFLQTCFGTNIELSNLEFPPERSVNESLDLFLIESLRKMNTLYNKLPDTHKKPYLKFRQEIVSSLRQWDFTPAKVDINTIFGAVERRLVVEKFRPYNQKLLHEYSHLIANSYNTKLLFDDQINHGPQATYPDLAEMVSTASINDWLELVVRVANK